MTREDWKKKAKEQNSFVVKILKQPKIFIIGSDHELQGIG
jgi:hypothetical protein